MTILMTCICAAALTATTVCPHPVRQLGPTVQVPTALLLQVQMALLVPLRPHLMVSSATLFLSTAACCTLHAVLHTVHLVRSSLGLKTRFHQNPRGPAASARLPQAQMVLLALLKPLLMVSYATPVSSTAV